jgi:hypothetical protein
VAVGAAAPLLDFTDEQLLKHVEALFARKGEKIVEVNRRAFAYGRAAGLFFRGLVDGGMEPLAALSLCSKMDPATLDPQLAGAWADAFGASRDSLDLLLAEEDEIPCTRLP